MKPIQNPPLFDGAYGKDGVPTYHTAITLGDLFAGLAMLGMVVLGEVTSLSGMASDAYRHSDAMLAERAKRESDDG